MDDKSRALKCQYRLCQDGISELMPFITRQIAHAPLPDFLLLLETSSVLLDNFPSAEFTRQLRANEEGGMTIVLDCKEAAAISPRYGAPSFFLYLSSVCDSFASACFLWRSPIVVVCFRTYCSLNTLMTKIERKSYIDLLKTLVPESAAAAAAAVANTQNQGKQKKSGFVAAAASSADK